jgi:hypothetical protein
MSLPLPGQRVDVPLPPELTETFGYRGDARYVAFYHSPMGDEVIYNDGRSTGTGATWAFLAWRRHRAVGPLLAEWNLGYSDLDAEYALLIDRQQNRASVAHLQEVRPFLEAQHPPAPELTPEQREAFRREVERMLAEWRERPIDHEAVASEMAAQQGRIGRMMAWLDMCPVPEQGEGPKP